jgi:hypothetical protein
MRGFFIDYTCLQCIVILYQCKCSILRSRGQDSVVGILPRYRLDGPGIEIQ